MLCTQCGYNNPVTGKICRNCEVNLCVRPSDSAQPRQAAALIYAGFWVRLLAAFLDLLVIGAIFILLLLTLVMLIAFTGRDYILHDILATSFLYGVIICMAMAYYILMESGTQGATLGKRWLNIKVLDANGHRLTAARATARLMARLFSYLILLAGLLIQPFTRRKQALHDILAGTVIVRANDSTKISLMASLLVLFFALAVPVLALFVTAGLPFFQQHIMKVQLESGVQNGRETTLAVSRFYLNNGRVPADIVDAGVNIGLSPHVAAIVINPQDGEITVTFSDSVRKDISNKHLIFTPTLEADQSINWKCHSTDIEARILAATCQ